jgi:hypothetical protein
VTLRRTLLATRDGAAIAASAGRLAGLSATVDLLAAVPPLVAELRPAPSLGAGPPDLELLGSTAERAVSGEPSSHPAPRPLPASRLAAAATRVLAATDDRPRSRRPAAAGVAGSPETSGLQTVDADNVTRRLSPVARVEDTLRHVDRSGRGVIDRRVSIPLVAAAVPEPGQRPTNDLAGTVIRRPRPTGLGPAEADARGRLAAPATPVAAAAVPGSAVAQGTAVTGPGRTFADLGGDGSDTSHPPAAHHTGATVGDPHLAGSGEVARRLADLPELFATDRVASPSATGQLNDPPAATADRRPDTQPTAALEAAELEELLGELLAREAEAHGLDGRLT